MDPDTNEFVFVPIPESRPMPPELATPYTSIQPALARFEGTHPATRPQHVQLPPNLVHANMHLDPDFQRLTYGVEGPAEVLPNHPDSHCSNAH